MKIDIAAAAKAQRTARDRITYWEGQPSSERNRLGQWKAILWQLIRIYGRLSC